MSEKKYNWHKIADTINELQLQENNLSEIEVGGKKICIGKNGSVFFACINKCPHAGGILADGYIDATGNLVCPLHRYKFNPTSGRNISGEGYFLKTFFVEERTDGIFVCLNATNEL